MAFIHRTKAKGVINTVFLQKKKPTFYVPNFMPYYLNPLKLTNTAMQNIKALAYTDIQMQYIKTLVYPKNSQGFANKKRNILITLSQRTKILKKLLGIKSFTRTYGTLSKIQTKLTRTIKNKQKKNKIKKRKKKLKSNVFIKRIYITPKQQPKTINLKTKKSLKKKKIKLTGKFKKTLVI